MRPTHAERSRMLVAQQREGTLSTIASDPAGSPYGSFVIYAPLGESVVFLLSGLAEHTKNLEADPRASLLVVEPRGEQEALARDRVTLLGICRRALRSEVEPAFLARHPSAERYASFADFGYWRLEVESARFVGGFGRMSWIAGRAWAEADPGCDEAGRERP